MEDGPVHNNNRTLKPDTDWIPDKPDIDWIPTPKLYSDWIPGNENLSDSDSNEMPEGVFSESEHDSDSGSEDSEHDHQLSETRKARNLHHR